LKTRPLTILVSPLDWGLGHASRMIPLIRRFVLDGHNIILSGSGRSAEILRNAFPDLRFVSLPCHSVHLGSGKHSYFQILLQLPALVFSVFREHHLANKIVRDEAVDIVVSDNRYGLYCRKAYSVLITHQVSPALPAIFRWLEFPLYIIIRKLIQQFDQCWIPDFSHPEVNLSGKLSHRFKTPSNARYIGILSRFSLSDIPCEIQPSLRYEVAVVLSGPEPQVSIFEKQMFSQLIRLEKSAILLRGLRNQPIEISGPLPSYIHQVSHLEDNAFRQVLKQAGLVISRSGYSGIMDFIVLGISAMLVPSPGQSEQEYLATWLSEKGWFRYVTQDKLNLTVMYDTRYLPAKAENPLNTAKPDYQFINDLYRENCQDGY
jgi:UDP:flavonoid glycosyltransferase YjiC (YdhE family)